MPATDLQACIAYFNELADKHEIQSKISLDDVPRKDAPTPSSEGGSWGISALKSGVRNTWNWAFGSSSPTISSATKKIYRHEALALHPDKNRDNPQAAENFQKLASCYEKFKDGATDAELMAAAGTFSSPWQFYAIAAALGLKNAIIPAILNKMGAKKLAQSYQKTVYSFEASAIRLVGDVIGRSMIPMDLQLVHDACEKGHLAYLVEGIHHKKRAQIDGTSGSMTWLKSLGTTAWGATKAVASRLGLTHLSTKNNILLSLVMSVPNALSEYQNIIALTGNKMKAGLKATSSLVFSQLPTAALYGTIYTASYLTGGNFEYSTELGYAASLFTSYLLIKSQTSFNQSLKKAEKTQMSLGQLTHKTVQEIRNKADELELAISNGNNIPKHQVAFNRVMMMATYKYQKTVQSSLNAKTMHLLCALLEYGIAEEKIRGDEDELDLKDQLLTLANETSISELNEVYQSLFKGAKQSDLDTLAEISATQIAGLKVFAAAIHDDNHDIDTYQNQLDGIGLKPIEKMMLSFKLNGLSCVKKIMPMMMALENKAQARQDIDDVKQQALQKSPRMTGRFEASRREGPSLSELSSYSDDNSGQGLGLGSEQQQIRRRHADGVI